MFCWWANLAGSTFGFTLGSALLKRFADTGATSSLLLSFIVLGASNLVFVQVIRLGLGQGVIASSMLQIVLTAALGALVFGERFSAGQVGGVVLAVASIALIMDFGSYTRAG